MKKKMKSILNHLCMHTQRDKTSTEAMNAPTEPARETKAEAAALGGGGSLTGLGVWFVSEVGD